MTTIATNTQRLTLINTFHVQPERADELIELLVRATDETMRHQPGFVSANIHKSVDGTRVANYAQWASKADFERMFENPEARLHMKEAERIADSFEPVLYDVVHVDDRAAGPSDA